MAKITYDDKVALNEEPSVAEINKVTDANMNEIKTSVNNIYDNALVNKGDIPNNTDLNNLTEEGIYYTSNSTLSNCITENYNYCEIIVINQTVLQQILIKPASGLVYSREYSGSPSVWSSWGKLSYKPNAIIGYLQSNFTLSSTGTYIDVPLKEGTVVGGDLSVSNNKILCKRAGYIRVSASISFNSMTNGLKWLKVLVGGNDTIVSPNTLDTRATIATSPIIVTVNANSYVSIQVYGTTGDVVRGSSNYTYVTVEYVD